MAHTHFQRHHKKYLLGSFGSFAVVKMFVLFLGLVSGLTILQTTTHAAYENFCNENSGSLDVSVVECEALITLYNSTDGAHWINTGGWGVSTNICSRNGVSCNENTISSINLSGNNLSNVAIVSGYQNLIVLNLSHNALTGLSITSIPNITSLDLSYNALSSYELLQSIGTFTTLTSVQINDNYFYGTGIAALVGLTNLERGSAKNNCFVPEENQYKDPREAELGSELFNAPIYYTSDDMNRFKSNISDWGRTDKICSIQMVMKSDEPTIYSGDEIHYTISYYNPMDIPQDNVAITGTVDRGELVESSLTPTTSSVKKYTIPGDPCFDELQQTTGLYRSAFESMFADMGYDGFSGFINSGAEDDPDKIVFSAQPYNNQESLLGYYLNISLKGFLPTLRMMLWLMMGQSDAFVDAFPQCGVTKNQYIWNVGTVPSHSGGTITFVIKNIGSTYRKTTDMIITTATGTTTFALPDLYPQLYGPAKISLKNNSSTSTAKVWIKKAGAPDTRDITRLLSGVITDGMTDKQKAEALFHLGMQVFIGNQGTWYNAFKRAGRPLGYDTASFYYPIRFINALYDMCGSMNGNFLNLGRIAGLTGRMVYLNNHVIMEFQVNEDEGDVRGMFDIDGGTYYTGANNHIYSVDELAANPDIINNDPQVNYYGKGSDNGGVNFASKISGGHRYDDFSYLFSGNYYGDDISMDINLYPGDEIIYQQTFVTTRTNWHMTIDHYGDVFKGEGTLVRNLTSHHDISEQTTTGFVYQESFPYLIDDIQISMASGITNDVQVSVQRTGDSTWTDIGNIKDGVRYEPNPYARSSDIYEYKLKFTCDDCTISEIIPYISIRNNFRFNSRLIPITGSVDLDIQTSDPNFAGIQVTVTTGLDKGDVGILTTIASAFPYSEKTQRKSVYLISPNQGGEGGTGFCVENSASLDVSVSDCEALVALYNSTDGANWTNTDNWGISTNICNRYGVTCSNSRVEQLNLSRNGLNGALPEQLGTLTGLTYLSLGGNHLTSLPEGIGNLKWLTNLDISANDLEGLLPETISQLTGLTYLDLGENRLLEGSIALFSGMIHLTSIHIGWSNLDGDIASLAALTGLTTLNIQGNNHYGDIGVFSGMTQLQNLGLGSSSYNALSGNFFDLSGLTNLVSLYILGPLNAHFTGDISFVSNLKKLTILRLRQIDIRGNLSAISELTGLTHLNLDYNYISGSLSSLSGLTELTNLDLGYNFITGNPRDILGLTKLTTLMLEGNLLTGELPEGLMNLPLTTGFTSENMAKTSLEGNYFVTQGYSQNFRNRLTSYSPGWQRQLLREGGDIQIHGMVSRVSSGSFQYTISYANIGTEILDNVDIQFPSIVSVLDTNIPISNTGDSKQYFVDGDTCFDDIKNETGVYATALNSIIMRDYGQDAYTFFLEFPSSSDFLLAPYSGQQSQWGDYIIMVGLARVFSLFGLSPADFSGSCGKVTPFINRNFSSLPVGATGEIILSMAQPTSTGYSQQIVLTGNRENISLGDDGAVTKYLTVHNASTGGDAVHFWIKSHGGPDLRSNDLIIQSVITGGMTEKEKALAIRRVFSDYKTHYPVYGLTDLGYRDMYLFRVRPHILEYERSPVEFLNTLYGECEQIAPNFIELAQLAGLEGRGVGLNGHSVSEIKIDGKRSFIDTDMNGVYFQDSGGVIYSAHELNHNPSIITDQYPESNGAYSSGRYVSAMSGYVGWGYPEGIMNRNFFMDIVLYPQDTLVYINEIDPIISMVEMGKGILERHLSIGNTTQVNSHERTFSEFFPYLVENMNISSSTIGDNAVQVDISFNSGESRTSIGTMTGSVAVEYKLNTYQRKENTYAYQLRFSCSDNCNISEVINGTVIRSDFYFNAPSIPMTGEVDVLIDEDHAQVPANLVLQKSSVLNILTISATADGELYTGNNTDAIRRDTLDLMKLQNTLDSEEDEIIYPQPGGCGSSCNKSGTGENKTGTALILTGIHKAAPICTAYTPELNSAYAFAFSNDITTIDDCTKANLKGDLIRSHMSKMIVNFAIKVMKKTPNTGMVCNFTDMQHEIPEMQQYAKLACQLGLMGVSTDGTRANQTFNPQETVDRGQFGTILSRLLRGGENNGGAVYYSKHLDALKTAGLMKNISRPENTELRGRVMLMLMRANQMGK